MPLILVFGGFGVEASIFCIGALGYGILSLAFCPEIHYQGCYILCQFSLHGLYFCYWWSSNVKFCFVSPIWQHENNIFPFNRHFGKLPFRGCASQDPSSWLLRVRMCTFLVYIVYLNINNIYTQGMCIFALIGANYLGPVVCIAHSSPIPDG